MLPLEFIPIDTCSLLHSLSMLYNILFEETLHSIYSFGDGNCPIDSTVCDRGTWFVLCSPNSAPRDPLAPPPGRVRECPHLEEFTQGGACRTRLDERLVRSLWSWKGLEGLKVAGGRPVLQGWSLRNSTVASHLPATEAHLCMKPSLSSLLCLFCLFKPLLFLGLLASDLFSWRDPNLLPEGGKSAAQIFCLWPLCSLRILDLLKATPWCGTRDGRSPQLGSYRLIVPS